MSKIRNRPSFFGERDASRISLLVREDLFDQGECDTNPLEFLNDRSIDSSYFSAKHSIPAYGFENVRQIRDSEQPDEVDVLCVNCYECIPLSLVDIHSKFCTNPQLEEEDAETVHIDTRIKKIIVSIDIKIHQSYGDTIFTLEQLRELAYSSLDNSANPYSILSRLDRIINSILCVNQGISSIIIAKRLANLVELKSPYYDSRISNIERTLKQYDEEVEEHQKELNR